METLPTIISENVWGLAIFSALAILCLVAIWLTLGKLIKFAIILSVLAVIGYTISFYLFGEAINVKIVNSFSSAKKTVDKAVSSGSTMLTELSGEEQRREEKLNTDVGQK